MIKVGSQVYIVPKDIRTKPYHAIVKSIGSKYITLEDHPSYSRFSIRTHESVDDRDGWNPRLTLYESERDYQIMQEIQDERHKLIDKIKDKLLSATLEELKEIYLRL